MNPFAKKPVSEQEVTTLVRTTVAEHDAIDARVLDGPMPATRESSPDDSENDTDQRITGHSKLSKLIDDNFPFDESQLDAINGMVEEPFACLTGAAGTGKTTTTKKLVDRLLETSTLSEVDMEKYWAKGQPVDADDDYESPEKWVPSVAMCAFTGRATQMIKKNFPRDWHGNIMTIHRMLGFYPEFYEDYDDESGQMRNKMRFTPSYNADFKLPWDVILIDEAGMLGLDLWFQLLAACKDGCRIYMIGDINQLPPVHGKSVFGFAMCAWPSWELTHVHRQQGVDNPIVDNAWRILNGRMPESEGRFQMIPLKGDAQFSSRQVRKMIPELQKRGVYDPIRDSIITPINGEEGSRGFALGQLPLNREFALIFNPQSEHTRFIIDGGRERKQFAVGDKVMATKNDWDAGITNGMTGVIVNIEANGGYGGESRLFGPVEEVNRYLSSDDAVADHVDFSLDDLHDSLEAIDKGKEAAKESRDRGPSSHIVTVRFGDAEHGIEVAFGTLSEVGNLMTAYVVTCHKMQGGEAPTIVIICHDSHRAMLYREWLYTAVTRASEKCILLYTPDALKTALNKQKMKGSTLKEKVLSFNAAQNIGEDELTRQIVPYSASTRNKILDRTDVAVITPARLTSQKELSGGLAMLLKSKREQPAPSKPDTVTHVHLHVHATVERKPAPIKPRFVDGGDLTPTYKVITEALQEELGRIPTKAETGAAIMANVKPLLPAPMPKLVSQWGAYQVSKQIEQVMDWSRFLLPAPAPKPKPRNPFAKG